MSVAHPYWTVDTQPPLMIEQVPSFHSAMLPNTRAVIARFTEPVDCGAIRLEVRHGACDAEWGKLEELSEAHTAVRRCRLTSG